ncbi:ABC transporter permease [Actomonas aquatica]|uniref:FtsX-like permease family protein n=1 Tax=Actomonas aquatica TaxID=2866162 RepID=A0ABZ1C3F2_9BACT|nr:ABC transporter permease [Opitutus sp. WL0086]WRQ86125.1 FtsX-like permease family protein [Opitutus sp. WL0086]
MDLLDLKLLRDLRALKSQALAVALVMACGLAMMIMTRSLIKSLNTARDGYYEQHHFGEVFAALKRAPDSVRDELAAIPGVAALETSIEVRVTLDLPAVVAPASGLINSLPDRRPQVLHQLYLRRGQLLDTTSHHEVLVSEAFAGANDLQPGDRIAAVLNGSRLELRIAGIVLAPQYVFEAPPGSALPDNKTFGIFWMREQELAEAFNLEGAFNTVALTLAPGASDSGVIAELDRILEPYGGLGAYGRDDHPSDVRVSDEIRVLEGLSFGFPLVFLSVAAFMTHSVMSRQIALQREQIAVLKAFGFNHRTIAWHFIKFALAIVVVGTLLGALGGFAFGYQLVDMYHLFFRFPQLEFVPATGAILGALIASSAAALLGVAGAVRKVVRLAPAEAMRPEPPASFRPSLVERAGISRWFSVTLRMSLRNLERKPWQACFTAIALAMATGILIIPNAFRDGIRFVLDFQWDVVQRQSVTVSLVEPGPLRAVHDFAQLPGVVRAEPFRGVSVELISGHRTRRLGLNGLSADGHLNRVLGPNQEPLTLPAEGVIISRTLGDALQVRPGDPITIKVLQGKRRQFSTTVAAFADDFAGIAAYMRLDALNRALGEGDRISGAFMTVARDDWPRFMRELKDTPQASGVVIKDAMRQSFRDTTAESIGMLQVLYSTFATIVAFGIVYNSARIALSERARELATLRVLGFSQGDVGSVLVGELVVLTALALPLGLWLGSGMAAQLLESINTETVRLPLILTPGNYAYATLVIVLATTLSAIIACRKLNQLDLVSALKARD